MKTLLRKSTLTASRRALPNFLSAMGIGLVVAATVPLSLAAPISWSGGGANATWSTTGNWTGGVVPGAADDVTVGPTYTSGLTITVGGTAGTPTQINSMAFDTGTAGGNKFLANGHLQINTGNITTAGNQSGWLDSTLYIPGTGSGVNNWSVSAGNTLRVRGNIAVIGGSGTPTITVTGATGALNLDNATQAYAGNWNISAQSAFVRSFGSGAVSLSNTKFYTSTATSNAYSNNLTWSGFARISTGATQTLTFSGGWTGAATGGILFNTDGGGTSTGATVRLAGTPTSFTASNFDVIGTLELDTAGYLAGVAKVALNRGSASTYGIVNWNVAENVAATTTFNNTQASADAQLGMLATGTTTINGQYKLNNSATVTDGAGLTLNAAVSGARLVLAGQVTDSANTTVRALTKIGAGTAVLSATTNNFRGGTTVSAGTLLVTNTSGSGLGTGNVTVNGGTLGGSGAFTGTVTVNSGGALAPGSSIESLASGALTLNTGSTFGYEVDFAAPLATGADLQKVTGALSLNGTVTLTLANLSAGTFADGTTFTLINYSGAWNNGLFTYGTVLNNGDTFMFNSQLWRIDYNATVGGSNFASEYVAGNFVNMTAIPEPATWALLAFSLTTVAVLRRRLA
jgi:autotransporter-associated beta strand protein